jgi:DNA topoisomerase-1
MSRQCLIPLKPPIQKAYLKKEAYVYMSHESLYPNKYSVKGGGCRGNLGSPTVKEISRRKNIGYSSPFKMVRTLLIVESPAKCRTIEKLLGDGYVVKASFGHIRDLTREGLGIDIANGFQPEYVLSEEGRKKAVVRELKQVAGQCDRIFLASDEDREGEAIAWHVATVLGLPIGEEARNRITFHEITKTALERAVRNPRSIDMNMVGSQQARRVLDRLVGFHISPVLWKNVAPRLSAGRVQSVALKMIVDREKQVEAHQTSRLFRTGATFQKGISATLNQSFGNGEEAKGFLGALLEGGGSGKKTRYLVAGIDRSEAHHRPLPPFITSTIQQEAGGKFHLSAKRIMGILQKLYEHGKITYHRTDSVNLSVQVLNQIKEFVLDTYGSEYHHGRSFKTKAKGAQEAHEAIRPTSITRTDLGEGEGEFDKVEKKIYELIWKRTVASQMSDCVTNQMTMRIDIQGPDFGESTRPFFTARAEEIIFDGYRRVYQEFKREKVSGGGEGEEEEEVRGALFEGCTVGDSLRMKEVVSGERVTQPPPRLNEAMMVREMEKSGIGRPSTYASILETIQERAYVEMRDVEGHKMPGKKYKITNTLPEVLEEEVELEVGGEKKKLVPTQLGRVTNHFLEQHFSHVFNYDFTSQMESKLDEIAEGRHVWNEVVGEYYREFQPTVDAMMGTRGAGAGIRSKKRCIGTDEAGKRVYVYVSKKGPVFQVGDDDDAGKSFVNLDSKVLSLESVTIDDFLGLERYPKILGVHQENQVLLKKGPYGLYVSYGGKNYKASESTTLESFVTSLSGEGSSTSSSVQLVKELGKYQVKMGRYGPYVQFEKHFAKVPKGVSPEELTKEQCKELIAKAKSQSKEVNLGSQITPKGVMGAMNPKGVHLSSRLIAGGVKKTKKYHASSKREES